MTKPYQSISKLGRFFGRTTIAVVFCSMAASLCCLSFAVPTRLKGNASKAEWRNKVDPAVLTAATMGPTDFMIYVTPIADLSGAKNLATKKEKGRYVVSQLMAAAEAAQPAVRQTLNSLGAEYTSFWISNVISAKGNAAVLEAVASLPQVASITAPGRGGLKLPPQKANGPLPFSPDAVSGVEGSLMSVNADDVWAMGYRGQGAVVAGADTGVRWTHNALKPHYRGWNGTTVNHDYNWHDAIPNPNDVCPGNSTEPCDDDTLFGGGHGSHTVGTMVGDDGGSNQIGMAPGAKWIACRNMNHGVGVPATSYLGCMQFFLAPTKIDGTGADPDKSPDVINNSWGCVEPGCVPEPNPPVPGFLRATLQASRAAGIAYVVSAGNEGNDGTGDCSTLEFPLARYPEAFSVGAINHRDNLPADFSSRGPVMGDPDFPTGLLKPNIAAPGVTIRSVQRASDTAYASLSGTSMSGPHVAGLVALIISANPNLRGNVDRIEQIIEQSAVHMTTTQACGSDTPTSVPNNVFGWGRIDALAAVNMALADIGCPVPPFIDDLEPAALPGWTFDVAQNGTFASSTWALTTDPNAHSLTHSFFSDASDPSGVKDDRLIAPPQKLTANSHLIFWHQFKFEEDFDGGVLEISTDGGNNWVDVITGGGSFVSGGYNGTIDTDFGSPIPGRSAWTGLSGSAPMMNRVEVNFGAFAGQTVLVRWRLALDDISLDPGTGWWVDDVQFTNLACAGVPTPVSAVSRKTHGATNYDVNLLPPAAGIEPRSGGGNGDFKVVVGFPAPVTVTGNPQASLTGTGSVSSVTVTGNEVTVNLTGVTNAQRLTVTLNGVNGSTNVPINMAVLLGDTNADGSVNSADISQTKAQSGQPVTNSNFREDLNVDNTLNSADISLVKSKSGTALP